MSKEAKEYSLIEAGCDFWFNDNERARSPFPKEIQPELKQRAQVEYLQWLENLTGGDRDEVDDDELVSVFEMLLFGEALKMVDKKDTDQIITIHHPFMPRVGDVVNDAKHGPSKVVERKLAQEKDKKPFMLVLLETIESGESWHTEFLLPDRVERADL